MVLLVLSFRGRCRVTVSSSSLFGIDPCCRDGVREHRREQTRSDGTEPARHPLPEVVPVSGDTGGAVRPPWIPQNRRRAARAGALIRSAAAFQAVARFLQLTFVRTAEGSGSRGGSAPQ